MPLAGARIPADRGLSSLGLLMHIAGTLGVIIASIVALAGTFHYPFQISGVLFCCGALCGIRSAYHRAAGTELLFGTAPQPAISRYFWLCAFQTAACLFLLRRDLSLATAVPFAAVFMAWPVALRIAFALPAIGDLTRRGVPDAEDYGFEGASVLMTAFGAMGVLVSTVWLIDILGTPAVTFSHAASSMTALAVAVLAGRSLFHLRAGLRGVAGASYEEHSASARSYCDVGVGSAACVGATTFVVSMLSAYPLNLWLAMVMGTATGMALFAWPGIVRRMYVERNFDIYAAGADAPTFHRSPDAGLSALGWLLLAISTPGLALAAADLAFGSSTACSWAGGLAGWLLAAGCLGSFAGIELLRMSRRAKRVAIGYGVANILVVLGILWPGLDGLDALASGPQNDAGSLLATLQTSLVYVHLALAMVTLALVRRVVAPVAVARHRAANSSD